MSSSTHWKNK